MARPNQFGCLCIGPFLFWAIFKLRHYRWLTTLDNLLDGKSCVMTETFLWSSYRASDLNKLLETAQGQLHLQFSKSCNDELFRAVKPRAVIFPGLGHAAKLAKMYSLNSRGTLRCEKSGHRLVERFHDGVRPWFVHKTLVRKLWFLRSPKANSARLYFFVSNALHVVQYF